MKTGEKPHFVGVMANFTPDGFRMFLVDLNKAARENYRPVQFFSHGEKLAAVLELKQDSADQFFE